MKIILILMFSFLASAKEINWNLNDVSILFKIPSSTESSNKKMISPFDNGIYGKLVPYDLYDRLPPLDNAGNGKQTMFDNDLKLVGLRLDPCPNTLDQNQCKPEVRLVWQPVVFDQEENQWVANDASLHTFYQLSKNQFTNLTNKLAKIKIENLIQGVDTELVPLNIHPALNSKNADSFFRSLKTLILDNCGEKNIYKITFMSLLTRNVWWRFGGIQKDKDTWETIIIPRLNIGFVDIFNNGIEEVKLKNQPGKSMDSIINILPDTYPSEDDLTDVINNSYRFNDDRDEVVFKEKISAINRMENPLKTNPTNLDCASCHFASDSRYYINQRFPAFAKIESKDFYKNPNTKLYKLDNTSIGLDGTRLVRAFGYFYDKPSINMRVINDSAETAEWMNKYFKIK